MTSVVRDEDLARLPALGHRISMGTGENMTEKREDTHQNDPLMDINGDVLTRI